MSAAATLSGASLTSAQQQFTATLAAIEDAVHYAFRGRLRPQEYEEALAEAKAAAWSAWAGLIKRGKDPVEVGVHAIARNAIRYVKSGRKLGNRTCGHGAMDVQHPRVRRALGLRVVPFEELTGPPVGSWRDWLTCDKRVGPADEAAFRIDFEGWLAGLPERKRRIAALLAEGHEAVAVAGRVGVSPARVCQVRAELEANWRQFQGEAEPRPGRSAVGTA